MNPNKIERLLLEKVLGYEEAKSIWYDDFDKSKIYYKRDYYDLYVIEYHRDEWMQYLFNPLNNFEDAWQVVKENKRIKIFYQETFY